jgi:hypothetical protein
MKSTNLADYQSDFFIQAMSTYLKVKNYLVKTILTEYPYHVAGNQYLGLRVDYMLPLSTELTDDEVQSIRFFDDCLEIFLGRNVNNIDDKNHAQSEISNLIKLFDGFCENVVINPTNDDDDDDRNIINLKSFITMRSYRNFYNEHPNFPFSE